MKSRSPMIGVNQARAMGRNHGISHGNVRAAGEYRRDQNRPQAGYAPGYFPTERLGTDSWFYAPYSGSCYHIQRNCGGLRNARAIKSALSLGDKRKVLTLLHLRPCRICVVEPINHERGTTASDTVEVPLAEVD